MTPKLTPRLRPQEDICDCSETQHIMASQPSRTAYRPHLTQRVIAKAPGLLPMHYTPVELASELGLTPATLREWTRHGLPHTRDGQARIWIDGKSAADWIAEQRAEKQSLNQPDQGYCLRCRCAVRMDNPTLKQHGRLTRWQGTCPNCSAIINRGVRRG